MYETFFGLSQRPFDLTPDPRFVVLTESHQEALNTLEYGIAARKGLMVLIGEAGSGKTTLIRTAIDRQSAQVHSVHLSNPTLSRAEFVEMLAARFGLSDAARASKTSMLIELETLLRYRASNGETTLLIVDEAQSLPAELLEEVRLLANIESNQEKLLQVVLAGQPELGDLLDKQDLRQLKQRVALRSELGRLTEQDTVACVAGRLRQGGAIPSEVFTREAVARLHEHATGLPRTICVLADNALLAGFAAGRKPVSADLVDDVARTFAGGRAVERPAALSVASSLARDFSPAVVPSAAAMVPHGDETVAAPPSGTATAPEGPSSEGAPVAATPPRGELFGTFGTKRRRFAFFGN